MGLNRHSLLAGAANHDGCAMDRKFNIDQRYGDGVNPDQVHLTHPESRWTYVSRDDSHLREACNRSPLRYDGIIIAVDGACPNNGTAGVTASIGVYVGKGSEYNHSSTVKHPNPTNQIAELTAGIRGLETALDIEEVGVEGKQLRQVVIKTDSEYLAKGMTEWIFVWKENGYKTAKKTQVTNEKLFRRLDDLVMKLNDLQVEVLFWRVSRVFNREADLLANQALKRGREH